MDSDSAEGCVRFVQRVAALIWIKQTDCCGLGARTHRLQGMAALRLVGIQAGCHPTQESSRLLYCAFQQMHDPNRHSKTLLYAFPSVSGFTMQIKTKFAAKLFVATTDCLFVASFAVPPTSH
jgi:hypothetical protein